MDWATLFKDNSASILTLVGVFLGSAITFLVSYLNNRFEANERDKDRQEQRTEAKIQAREKWIERDILTTMDSIEKLVRVLSEHESMYEESTSLERGFRISLITEEEFRTGIKSLYDKVPLRKLELTQLTSMIEKLVFSFEEEKIISGYSDLAEATNKLLEKTSEHLQHLTDGELTKKVDTLDEWRGVRKIAGNLHRALREKLISIRD